MLVFAHRGASADAPENTLLAVKAALTQGCDGIELDVQYHQASGEFVLIHDRFVQYKGQQTHFNQLSITELLNIESDPMHSICTLPTALDLIAGHCLINIEIKSSAQSTQLTQEITQLKKIIQQAKIARGILDRHLVISSFNHSALISVATLLPDVQTAALIACCPVDYAKFCQALNVSQLNLSIDCLNQEIVADAHSRGLKVWVYTVDGIDDIKLCKEYGVDAIFTNFPQYSNQRLLALK